MKTFSENALRPKKIFMKKLTTREVEGKDAHGLKVKGGQGSPAAVAGSGACDGSSLVEGDGAASGAGEGGEEGWRPDAEGRLPLGPRG